MTFTRRYFLGSLLSCVLLCVSWPVWAESGPGPGEFLLGEGAGARASGMGGAFVAVADDATAGYWNPAGLSQMDLYVYQAGLQYGFLPHDMSTSLLSYAFYWPGAGNFSLTWLNYSIGNIEARDENGDQLGSLTSIENAFLLSYGRKMYEWADGLSLGLSLKMLHQGIGGFSAYGPGMDVGVLWQPVMYWDHMVGVNVQNLLQSVRWNDSGIVDASPVNVKIGTALKFFRSREELYFNHLIQTMDLNISEHSRVDFRTGIECWYTRDLGMRVGYNGREVMVGASYRPENFEIDYAFHYSFMELSNNQHRVSLLLRFKSAPVSPAERAGMPEPQEILEPEVTIHEDSTPHDDANAPKIAAKVLEIQRVGEKAYKVILNVGANQGIRRGYEGSLMDAGGQTVAGIIVQQVDPKLCLAEIAGVAKDVPNDATAIIRLPMRKKE
jgi:hypothetical protein